MVAPIGAPSGGQRVSFFLDMFALELTLIVAWCKLKGKRGKTTHIYAQHACLYRVRVCSCSVLKCKQCVLHTHLLDSANNKDSPCWWKWHHKDCIAKHDPVRPVCIRIGIVSELDLARDYPPVSTVTSMTCLRLLQKPSIDEKPCTGL